MNHRGAHVAWTTYRGLNPFSNPFAGDDVALACEWHWALPPYMCMSSGPYRKRTLVHFWPGGPEVKSIAYDALDAFERLMPDEVTRQTLAPLEEAARSTRKCCYDIGLSYLIHLSVHFEVAQDAMDDLLAYPKADVRIRALQYILYYGQELPAELIHNGATRIDDDRSKRVRGFVAGLRKLVNHEAPDPPQRKRT